MKIRISLYKGYTKGTECTQKLQTKKNHKLWQELTKTEILVEQ